MSEITKQIYILLRQQGLSAAGAAGVMGNYQMESGMTPDNAQDSYGYGTAEKDAAYTAAVDNGSYTRFAADGVGYGLWQATWGPYKAELLKQAKAEDVSIADEQLQVDVFCALIKSEMPGLWSFLCTTDNVFEAARRICIEFERPAVANVAPRAAAATGFYNEFRGLVVPTTGTIPAEPQERPQYWPPRIVDLTMEGPDVAALQAVLYARGYIEDIADIDGRFGSYTTEAVINFQNAKGLKPDGVAGPATWAALLERR